MFPNEHPTYVSRRLEARMAKLDGLRTEIEKTAPDNAETMKRLLLDTVGEMQELTLAAGILAGRVLRAR